MTEHLGGPETPETIAERHERYLRAQAGDRMFRIVDSDSGEGVGSVGYWDKEWRDDDVYELGWMVLPEFQGRGIAVEATRLAIEHAAHDAKHRYVHAFPKITNGASNAICRKLGFRFLDECDFEYPKGNPIRCNDWRLDLTGQGSLTGLERGAP
jgi:RimJ/RimL family protein N-acetyltransferase